MTNPEMAELLLKRAERIDAMNAFGMTADYVRELAEEAAAMRAGAKALLSSPESAQPWTSRERRLREAAKAVEVLVSGGYFVPHETLSELRAALADTPPPDPASVESTLAAVARDDAERTIERMHGPAKPDPRDEALERAKDRVWKVVMFLDGVHRHKLIENYSADYAGLQEARTQAADALAAIARAKGGR